MSILMRLFHPASHLVSSSEDSEELSIELLELELVELDVLKLVELEVELDVELDVLELVLELVELLELY